MAKTRRRSILLSLLVGRMSAALGGIIGIHARPPRRHEGHRMQQGQGSCGPGDCFSPSPSTAHKSSPADTTPASANPACGEAAAARPWTARTHAKRPAIKARAIPLCLGASFAMVPREPGTRTKSSSPTSSRSEYSPLLPDRHRRAGHERLDDAVLGVRDRAPKFAGVPTFVPEGQARRLGSSNALPDLLEVFAMQLDQVADRSSIARHLPHGRIAAIDTALDLECLVLGVLAAKEGLVDMLPFSPHLGSLGIRFERRALRAEELRRNGWNNSVDKSARESTRQLEITEKWR